MFVARNYEGNGRLMFFRVYSVFDWRMSIKSKASFIDLSFRKAVHPMKSITSWLSIQNISADIGKKSVQESQQFQGETADLM